MNLKNLILQTVVLVLAASICALISNTVAGRERKLVLPGYYPNALKVPERAPSPPPAATAPAGSAATTTAAPAPPAALLTETPLAPLTQPATTTTPALTTKQPAGKPAAAQPAPQPAAAQPAPARPQVSVAERFPPHPDKAYLEISGEDTSLLHAAGTLVIDARRTSVYQDGHIAGSRSFPVWESDIDDRVMGLYNERNDPRAQAQPIVIYCSGGDCEDSHMLAQKLWGVGFNGVYVYKDGFPDWQKRGGTVHKGANP